MGKEKIHVSLVVIGHVEGAQADAVTLVDASFGKPGQRRSAP